MDEELRQLKLLADAARGAIRDGVPIEQVNEAIAKRTEGAITSFLKLTSEFTRLSAEADREKTGALSAAVQNFGQTASFGFSDELSGIVGGIRAALPGDDRSFGEGFRESTDFARESLSNARRDRPGASIAGGVAGLIGPGALLARGAAGVGRGVLAGAEGLLAGVGSGEGLRGRATGGSIGAGVGLATGGLLNIVGRGARLGNALRPSNRAARRPFQGGIDASDALLTRTGSLARPIAEAGEEAVESGAMKAFDTGRRVFKRPPADAADAIRRAGRDGLAQRVRDGLAQEVASSVSGLSGKTAPRAVIQKLTDPAMVKRIELIFDNADEFASFMEPLLRAAKLQTDAAAVQAIGEITRNALVFGAGAGFSALLARSLR